MVTYLCHFPDRGKWTTNTTSVTRYLQLHFSFPPGLGQASISKERFAANTSLDSALMQPSCSICVSTHHVSLRYTGLFLLRPESVCSIGRKSTLSRIDINILYRFVGYAHHNRIAVYSDINSSLRTAQTGIDHKVFWLCSPSAVGSPLSLARSLSLLAMNEDN